MAKKRSPEAYKALLASNRASAARRKADPERHRRHLEVQRANRKRRAKKPLTPEQLAAKKRSQAKWRAARDADMARRETYRAREREAQAQRRLQAGAFSRESRPSGSVLITAAPSPWRDVLAEISRLVPRIDDRDDVIAEAAMLVVDGMDVSAAVAQAKRAIVRAGTPYRYMVPIEECFWI